MRQRLIVLGAAFIALVGWDRPFAVQQHRPADAFTFWTLLPVSGQPAEGAGLLADKLGFYWLSSGNAIVHLSVNDSFTVYSTGSITPTGLAMGAGFKVYSTGCCTLSGQSAIVVVDQIHNTVTDYTNASGDMMNDGVVLGPDGNIWFTEQKHVAQIDPNGTITEYAFPLPNGILANSTPGITSSSGRVWFPINNDNQPPYNGYIASIRPKTRHIAEYPVPCFDPAPLVAAGRDGDIYAACRAVSSTTVNMLRMTTTGATTVFSNPLGISAFGSQAMIYQSKAIWFITFDGGSNPLSLGAFATKTGAIFDNPTPSGLGALQALSPGPVRDPSGGCCYLYAEGGTSQLTMGQFTHRH
jgi:streptogramin lyase